MKKLLATGFCMLLGLSLVAGCGGGGSAVQSLGSPPPHSPPPHSPPPSSTPTSSPLMLVNPAPVAPVFNVGQFNGFSLSNWVQGGVAPITFSVKSGTLAAGLTLNRSTGDVSGIPTTVSVSNVVVTFRDSGNPPISLNVSISITINPTLPFTSTLSSGAPPTGTVGVPYACHWWSGYRCLLGGLNLGGATGGMQPYVFSWAPATGSSLPPGLSLVSASDGCGAWCSAKITGRPTMVGTYNFLVTVTDSELPPKQVSANYTITVAP